MNLSESLEWEIPQSKINTKLTNIEKILTTLVKENEKYKQKLDKQYEIIKKFEDNLSKNRIMYVELLKMHKKFHLETKSILQRHKESITEQLENNNMGYKEIVNLLQDNKVVLNKIETLGLKNKDIKPMLDQMKNNNNKIKNNLSSAVFRYRNDNLLWRSYSNKFTNNYPNILNVLKE